MADNELLQFPSNLNSNNDTPFVKLVSLNWNVSKKRDVNIETTRNITDTFVLPLPTNGMSDSLNITWQEEAGLTAQGIIGAIKNAGFSAVKNLLGSVSAKISYNRGQTLNDLASSTFENVEFRTHTFNWKLIPTSKNDADILEKMITRFKRNALPQKISENILSYPSFWKIEVYSASFKILLDYDVSVITEISTDFMPDQVESFHADGMPVSTNLSIGFKELSRTSRTDYEE